MALGGVTGRIVDSHAHLGTCRVFDSSVSEDELLRTMDAEGVEASLVMPYPGDPVPIRCHDRIAALAERHPGRIFGLVNLSPHGDEAAFRAEARRCVQRLGFVGIKLHTIGHAVNPLSPDGELVFRVGDDLGVPVIVHSGPGVPFALPALCLPAARRHPDLKIVLAHSGHSVYFPEALVCAQEAENIYLETSWITVKQVHAAVRSLGPAKVMFGSDGTANVAVGLAHYAHAGLTGEELEQSLTNTPCEVFGIRPRPGRAPRTPVPGDR